eukprot:TRINITY_DN22485_c0_g2_i1.p1 TRINITY_DN22485_c0_g2~~TRINITY_DN22485_c0_g2_i1.p1  ORF type:complete len:702 (+),score=133.79 TRINITY_DN22485_c0_g2_i1:75-2108(+)
MAPRGRQRNLKPPTDPESAMLIETFRRFDDNGDGVISREELARVFQAVDPVHWSDARIERLMEEADTNGDGLIKYEEFCAWLITSSEGQQDHWQALQLRGDRSFDAGNLVADSRATACVREEFIVKLEQTRGTKIGIQVDASDVRCLVIKALRPKSLVAEWNATNNQQQVGVGDMIVCVDGSSGNTSEMMKTFANTPARGVRHISITVQPKESSYRYVASLTDQYEVPKDIVDEDRNYSLRYVVHRPTGIHYAAKSIHKRGTRRGSCESEIEAMKNCDHPSIVKLFDVFEDFHDIHLVTEQCPGGELIERIIEDGQLTERHTATVMQQIFAGLAHMRSKRVVHRDIRPENILLDQDLPIDRCTVKITGFGCARTYVDGAWFATQAGDMEYKSPQMVAGSYQWQCDLWACGVLLYCLIVGYPPFCGDTDNETARLVHIGKVTFLDEDWKCTSNGVQELILNLLEKDERIRMTADAALAHPWLNTNLPRVTEVPLVAGQGAMKRFCGHNRLKKASCHALAQRLTAADIADLKQMFDVLDTNHDSTITFHEMKTGFDRLGKAESLADIRAMFEEVDVDGSRRIDYTEFVSATLDRQRYRQEAACWTAFRVFDRDSSGRICKRELAELLSDGDVQATSTAEALERVLKECDADGDGEIDFEEFMRMMQDSSDDLGSTLRDF